ncbi:hypothetical protein C8A05DRAFT_18869, partial [Staphylotrichum tortipilum]
QYLRDACPLEVFTRLGMAHTCCVFGWAKDDSHAVFPSRHQRDPETVRQLEDEDFEFCEQLECILELYDKALKKYKGTVDEFWEWWWAILQPLLPEIPARERRRTFGDYHLNHSSGGLIDPCDTALPDPRWEYYWAADDEEVGNDPDDSQGHQEMDFLDEIREYFANILSQDLLGSDTTQQPRSDEAAVLGGVTEQGPEGAVAEA